MGENEIQPGHYVTVNTGLKLETPSGIYARICSKSGLASRRGIHISAGVVDPTFRGEIRVVFNFGRDPFFIARGMTIGQMVFERFITADLHFVENLHSVTIRGECGFGFGFPFE